MRTLTDYHNKHVLISGQGATEEIGRMYVFKSIEFNRLYSLLIIGLVLKV
jgi:hypothetical protein